jgi:pimeloyl-ACP methyl ester carboxylesterase
MNQLWPDTAVETANLTQNISVLRRLLDESRNRKFIETVARTGYRFVAEVTTHGELAAMAGEAPPETRYTKSGEVNLAYQVVGEGPIDLVFVMGWVSHLEYFWQEPAFARFLRRLASFSRLILFDKRGTGLSDRVPLNELPTLEQRMEDLHAVMDAAGSQQAVILGVSEGGPMSALFAATYPERTTALVMIGTYAKRLRDETYPWGPSREEWEEYLDEIQRNWGGPVGLESRAPSRITDPTFRRWWATYLRMGASPGAAAALTRMNSEIDVRAVLPLVRVPTVVLHRTGDRCLRVEEGRFAASLIPGARFIELPGEDHLPFVGQQDEILDEIENMVRALRPGSAPQRVLATVLRFTLDALDETACAEIRREIGWFGGRVVEMQDCGLAIFDGPARAIRCAAAISEFFRRTGRVVRAAVHTGECDLRSDQSIQGLAIDIAALALKQAAPGEVLVSSTVRDLVAGSGLTFSARAGREVVTPHGAWPLLRVD